MKKMRALVKSRRTPGIWLEEVPIPEISINDVLIKIHKTSICGTDIHIFKSEYVIKPPVILGHELSGEVAEIGPGVTRFKVGDRVTVNPSAGLLCGHCRYCRLGMPFLCMDRAAVGSGIDGGFARYCGVREEIVFSLPQNLDFDAGALSEPYACALQAVVELTEILPGELIRPLSRKQK